MGLVHAGMAQHGTVVFTHDQTKGKGQREKQWYSSPRENITLSIIIEPFDLFIKDQFLLSMSVAIGVHAFFSKYAGEETKIKWPNDLYWRDRKAGGILIENVIKGNDWKHAVIGIGINTNQLTFDGINNKAVSLKQITGKSFDTLKAAKELIACVNTAFGEMLALRNMLSKYHMVLYKWKQPQRFKAGSRIFEAIITGVASDGSLIVTHAVEEYFRSGEIEWID
jgi:BirA family biotin operon repressor/biotin-[acetyl-CoA-carboxylase] ligase